MAKKENTSESNYSATILESSRELTARERVMFKDTQNAISMNDFAESAKSVIGTLKYVEEYTGFSSDPKQQQGNFLAFKVACDLPFTNITAKKGDGVEKSYDPSDSTFIYIMDKHYPITVKAYNGDKCVSMRTYSTDQLVFEPAEN